MYFVQILLLARKIEFLNDNFCKRSAKSCTCILHTMYFKRKLTSFFSCLYVERHVPKLNEIRFKILHKKVFIQVVI